MDRFSGRTLALGEMAHGELRRALAYWEGKRGGRRFPARADIDPAEMVPFLAHVLLVAVSYEPLDFRYRVFGTAVARFSGVDNTGRSVSRLEPPGFARVILAQYREIVARGEPMLHGVAYSDDERTFVYQRLGLPLSSDGTVIDKLLCVSMEDARFWERATGDPDG